MGNRRLKKRGREKFRIHSQSQYVYHRDVLAYFENILETSNRRRTDVVPTLYLCYSNCKCLVLIYVTTFRISFRLLLSFPNLFTEFPSSWRVFLICWFEVFYPYLRQLQLAMR